MIEYPSWISDFKKNINKVIWMRIGFFCLSIFFLFIMGYVTATINNFIYIQYFVVLVWFILIYFIGNQFNSYLSNKYGLRPFKLFCYSLFSVGSELEIIEYTKRKSDLIRELVIEFESTIKLVLKDFDTSDKESTRSVILEFKSVIGKIQRVSKEISNKTKDLGILLKNLGTDIHKRDDLNEISIEFVKVCNKNIQKLNIESYSVKTQFKDKLIELKQKIFKSILLQALILVLCSIPILIFFNPSTIIPGLFIEIFGIFILKIFPRNKKNIE